MPDKKKSIEQTYQKKTQLEHILLRPDTYIGSIEKQNEKLWLLRRTHAVVAAAAAPGADADPARPAHSNTMVAHSNTMVAHSNTMVAHSTAVALSDAVGAARRNSALCAELLACPARRRGASGLTAALLSHPSPRLFRAGAELAGAVLGAGGGEGTEYYAALLAALCSQRA
eukprot:gene11318-17679_t